MSEETVRVRACVLRGIEAVPVTIEVGCSPGIPGMDIVPDRTSMGLSESRMRIRCALRSAGYELPRGRVTVAISPGDLPGATTLQALELPIAAGILAASRQIPPGWLEGVMVHGGLEMDGSASPSRGSVSAQLAAREAGMALLTAASAEVIDPALAGEVLGIGAIGELRAGLDRAMAVDPRRASTATPLDPQARVPAGAERALAVAARARRGIAACGSAEAVEGVARALASIMPPMGEEEVRTQAMVLSAAGMPLEAALGERPVREIRFRDAAAGPSLASIIGGGRPVAPGEISLAHGGVLLLDGAGELARTTSLAIGYPVMNGVAEIVRYDGVYRMPSAATVVARVGDRPLPDQVMNLSLAKLGAMTPLWVDLSTPASLEPGRTVADLRAEVAAARTHGHGESLEASEILADVGRAERPATVDSLSAIAAAICDLDRRDRVEAGDLRDAVRLMTASRPEIARAICDLDRRDRAPSAPCPPAPTSAQLRDALAGIPANGAGAPAEGRRRHV